MTSTRGQQFGIFGIDFFIYLLALWYAGPPEISAIRHIINNTITTILTDHFTKTVKKQYLY